MTEYASQELLIRAQSGDRSAAETLILNNSGLIWSIARRFFGRGVDSDDLYQLGCVGFLKAVYGYDASFGTQFSTYAVPKISGEIRRFLRDDGSIKVSRGIKERAYAIANAREKLVNTLGRQPTISELAAETGFSKEEIAVAENAVKAPESLQEQKNDDGLTLEQTVSDGETEEKMLEYVALRQAVELLDSRQKTVIHLRFYHGLTQDKTAKIMGISQVQVSRIEKKAVTVLRENLA